MKQVTALIRRSPLNSRIPSEALRMSLGLTLTDNKVTVVFIEDGVYLLTAEAPEAIGYADIKRHLKTLTEMGCELIAERESLEERRLTNRKIRVKKKGRGEIDRILALSDRVIGF